MQLSSNLFKTVLAAIDDMGFQASAAVQPSTHVQLASPALIRPPERLPAKVVASSLMDTVLIDAVRCFVYKNKSLPPKANHNPT